LLEYCKFYIYKGGDENNFPQFGTKNNLIMMNLAGTGRITAEGLLIFIIVTTYKKREKKRIMLTLIVGYF